ncbi:Uncharacterised protein [Gemella morbillorum]|uniref:hypothetical protein n=1 Tax=Gemella morbillorum TaxID=29391 RepID=UPI000DA2DAFE|nr:hypothetical protein [Gemella morbillorum]UBH80455.1 hypothetical protein LA320_07090 [Gemella morbillorum]SQH55850.1 Uncharacterised protein [Gemella morbillorum]
MKLFDKIKDIDFIALVVEDKGNVLVLSDRYGNLQFEGRLKNTPFDYILEINDNYYKENKVLSVSKVDGEIIYQEILYIENSLNKVREAIRDYRLSFYE